MISWFSRRYLFIFPGFCSSIVLYPYITVTNRITDSKWAHPKRQFHSSNTMDKHVQKTLGHPRWWTSTTGHSQSRGCILNLHFPDKKKEIHWLKILSRILNYKVPWKVNFLLENKKILPCHRHWYPTHFSEDQPRHSSSTSALQFSSS